MWPVAQSYVKYNAIDGEKAILAGQNVAFDGGLDGAFPCIRLKRQLA